MLNFRNLSVRRGPRLLFRDACFTIHAGQKVGITGANGSGKSSLLAVVRSELAPDAGQFEAPPGLTIAHVAQETAASERPAVECVIDGDAELRRVERELADAEKTGDGDRLALLYGRLESIGGYEARARAGRLMHGLGFRPEERDDPMSSFSGGWRMRLNLARALMCRSDVLLLDEPTNHLDLEAVIWLENWLRRYAGTLLLISHDREFLDSVVDTIVHIEHQEVRLYAGGYSDFERQRAEQLAVQQATYERQQAAAERMRRFVDRFRAKASKARQAQSRLKALERMEMSAPAYADSPFRFAFRAPERTPNPLLTLEELSAGYDHEPVLARVSVGLRPGERIAMLGPNGAGKSTLVRVLAGTLAPLSGTRDAAESLRVGYFEQHQLEQLRAGDSPLEHLQSLDREASEQALRDYLGGFGFPGDMALEPVAPLSGGEKARLVLALIAYQRPNLLLLDEPTNHLDMAMRHALEVALQDYEGAVVLVSHDRHLIRTVADDFWLVQGGGVSRFDGDLEAYREWLAERGGQPDQPVQPPPGHSAKARKERKREEAERRRRLQPLTRSLEHWEKEMETRTARKQALDVKLADSGLYAEERKDELQHLLEARAAAERAVREAEEAWLAAGEALEAAENA